MNKRNAKRYILQQQQTIATNEKRQSLFIIANVNGNNEENDKVFKNKVFTWVKLKLNILTKNGRLLS